MTNGTISTQSTTQGLPGADADVASSASSRHAEYLALTRRVAGGEVVFPPAMLTGQARREHVRSTLREDHTVRIEQGSSDGAEKFRKISRDKFKFFRGTALLFYRDMVGQDAPMPTVMALGDVHPKNFGVMPDGNGAPIFGVNDFDEALYAPFTWDLKRGVVGFWIAAEVEGGLKPKKRRKIVTRFLEGYLDAMQGYADRSTEGNEHYRMDNSPQVVRRLFREAWEDRSDWLRKHYLEPSGRGFRANDELQPISNEVEKFQRAVNQLVERHGIQTRGQASEFNVKDVCVRHGQGTASLGLRRYYVLIEGPSQDATDDFVLELKRARRSALDGLAPPSEFDAGSRADRIAHGQAVQLTHGDIFFGAVEIDNRSYISRERAPFRDDIDLDELSYDTWKEYARVCGAALAQAHALSDDVGKVDYDIEPSIIAASTPRGLFVDDLVRFAEEGAARLSADHAFFCEDYAQGAFDRIDTVYR